MFTGAVNAYNCLVAGEVSDGLMLHSLTSADYVRQVVKPSLAQGAQRAGRDMVPQNASAGNPVWLRDGGSPLFRTGLG